ncbi:heat shock 70 kDa protein BIP3-like isoform X1 [Malus sylvestris]|uniref:heat shock 70 kDa protein BIP3-like isoform X1 n=1 Tax=Malus sylvestris TaxID=3752 RepID=UPI0021ACA28E|nr:heat shock 70 kDa protein BIP3-like isoform X1 [Malus sylvestris]
MKSVPSTLALLLFFVSAITILALGDDDVVIGIDLGSDYACVGVYINNNSGRVEIIPNEQGNTATPSWVAFTDYDDDTGPLIGEAAKDQASLNAQRTIFHVKRLIGRKYDAPEVQRDINLLPYEVVNKDGKPCIQVKVRNKTKVFSPEEISAMILAKLKENAEAYLGKKIKHAVVTVPAYFTDAQRQATMSASNISGLNVVKILDETTAAAAAYGLDNKEQKNILVYHLGGGVGGGKIDDVNILTINNGVFELKGATSTGDSHVRGKDSFGVLRMMGSFIKLFKRKYNNNNNNEEKIKALEPIKKALEDAGINKTDIHEIVLVGGTSRIPKVQQLLKDFFNGKEPKKKGINPIEAVAFGAAVEGGVLFRLREGEGGDETKFKDQLFLDNTDPFRLLIKMNVGLMTKLVSKGAIFTPINESRTLSTYPSRCLKVKEASERITMNYLDLHLFEAGECMKV